MAVKGMMRELVQGAFSKAGGANTGAKSSNVLQVIDIIPRGWERMPHLEGTPLTAQYSPGLECQRYLA